ncbi:MAG: hypothetical protein KME31_08575 [Tolypothrix carrinoi HA7290-LM1]|jgi:hypothetical protein|nr:hypothetical protein [Tolypothrix carrinoi HA7290-LM1]
MDEFCIRCGSTNITFDRDYGFYRCNDCNETWAYPQDDPDYYEFDDLDLRDLLLEQFGNGRMTFIPPY